MKDVGRTLGFLPAETDRLAKLIPNGPAHSLTVEEAVQQIPEVRELYEKEERYRRLLDYSQTLEGLSPPLQRARRRRGDRPGAARRVRARLHPEHQGLGRRATARRCIVTQYDMTCLEKAGMLKMDFLGLKTLTVIHDAVATIRARHGALRHPETGEEYARPEEMPLDDPDVYRMLARGGTAGVFQFESRAGDGEAAADEGRPLRRPDRHQRAAAARARWTWGWTWSTSGASWARSRCATRTPTWRRCWSPPTG